MLRPLRTAFLLLLPMLSLLSVGCSTIYRPVYSPGKSNYKKPPEKREAEILLPDTGAGAGSQTQPALPPEATPPPSAPPAASGGLLDAPPVIPGLPN